MKMGIQKKNNKLWIALSIPLLLLAIISLPLLGEGCAIRNLTHYHCPGCGGKRAFVSLLKGEFVTAAKSNILVYLLIIPTIYWLLRQLSLRTSYLKTAPPMRISVKLSILLLLILTIFTVIRNSSLGAQLIP